MRTVKDINAYRINTKTEAERKKYKNRYRHKVPIGRNLDGSVKYKVIYADTAGELKNAVNLFIDEICANDGEDAVVSSSLINDINDWLYTIKIDSVQRNSFDRIEGIYKNQIFPVLNSIPHEKTAEITDKDISTIISSVSTQGYSYSTIKKVYRFFTAFFRDMLLARKIRHNPMDTVKLPNLEAIHTRQAEARKKRQEAKEKVESDEPLTAEETSLLNSSLRMEDKTMTIFTPEEIAKMKNVIENGYSYDYKTRNNNDAKGGIHHIVQGEYFLFMILTGIRKGEAQALQYSDIDFEKKTARIGKTTRVEKKRDSKTGKELGGSETVIGSPKSAKSNRVIPLSEQATDLIRALKAREPEGYDGFIAHGKDGKPLAESAFRRRFNTLLKYAGVEHKGMHTTRHTNATMLSEASSGDFKLVSEQLGHASVAFTEQTYVHTTEHYKETIMNKIKI